VPPISSEVGSVATRRKADHAPIIPSLVMAVRKAEVLVLRDQLGWHLVGLNMRRSTSLRVLGLTCLTRWLVR
jgi:hypothetical protein